MTGFVQMGHILFVFIMEIFFNEILFIDTVKIQIDISVMC